jgi:uncharacterized protein YoxC
MNENITFLLLMSPVIISLALIIIFIYINRKKLLEALNYAKEEDGEVKQ